MSLASKIKIIIVPAGSYFYFSYYQLLISILLYTWSSFWWYIQDNWYFWFSHNSGYLIKDLRQSIPFQDCIIKFCLAILSTPSSGSNLCSVYLLSNIPYNMMNRFSIHLFALQYESFLIMGFINKLDKNLSTLHLVVFDFVK